MFLLVINSIMMTRSWFHPLEPSDDPEELIVECIENSTTFLYSNFQYIIAAIAFSSSEPFRDTIQSNCRQSFPFFPEIQRLTMTDNVCMQGCIW
jgi:hypothetical protein